MGGFLATFELTDAKAQDWEDMAIGPGPTAGDWLYFGDIGDNAEERATIRFYRTPEPTTITPGSTSPIAPSSYQTLVAKYPDGAHNAETLLVDPVSGDIYVVTKAGATSGVYRWRAPQDPMAGTHTLERVGSVQHAGSTATGGDVSPRGDFVILKTYDSARLWLRPKGAELHEAFAGTPCTVKTHSEPQGETLAISPDGRSYSTLSEGTHQPIWSFAFTPP